MFNSRNLIGLSILSSSLASQVLAEEKQRIGPTALILDIGAQCPETNWEGWLRDAIDDRGLVKCMQLGDGFWSSIFTPFDQQIEQACYILHNDPDYAD